MSFHSLMSLISFHNIHIFQCTIIFLPSRLGLFLNIVFFFDVIVNRINFLICFLDCSLLVYRNINDFCPPKMPRLHGIFGGQKSPQPFIRILFIPITKILPHTGLFTKNSSLTWSGTTKDFRNSKL